MTGSNAARRLTVVTVVLLVAVGLGGCLPSVHALTEADHGRLVVVEVGDEIVIRLSGNASTGYQWERSSPTEFESTALAPIAEADYESLGSAPGSPGLFTFRYIAVERGTVTLQFEYRRPWEDEPPLDRISIVLWAR